MKVLIVTVAGMSTRFSSSVGHNVLKCIYSSSGEAKETLLSTLISLWDGFDKIVIVGGYMFDELKSFIRESLHDYDDKIVLTKNNHFSDYGSGYSLLIGLKAALELPASEIIFAEGDLFLDKERFTEICESQQSVITYNKEVISSDKSVAFYFNVDNKVRYIYDTAHGSLSIKEPFISIYNSAQVWKIANVSVAEQVMNSISEEDWTKTNLVFIQRYFNEIDSSDIEMICFNKWINCNVFDDYKKGFESN